MNHKILDKKSHQEITKLFTSAFTTSEGDKEGRLVGKLASELSSGIDNQNIICYGTVEEETIIAAIFFTRLRFEIDIEVYMLAPVAVNTEHQRKGIGQALINYGLTEIKNRSVAVVVTYGDPSFYSKLGFQPLSENVIQAPLKLSMPEGWLGQSLIEDQIPTANGRPKCVKEFNNPVYW